VGLGGAVRRNKYGAVRTTVEGVTFDSKAEANYYLTLRLLERAGQVRDIELQPSFVLRVNDVIVGTYRGDFRYYDAALGAVVVADVKGVKTPVYRLKKKLVKALHGIDIVEVS
jgi:hypothetical protein